MAIIDPRLVTRFPIPHEPGEWVELRRLSGYELRVASRGKGEFSDDYLLASIAKSVVRWSYADPFEAEQLKMLDSRTLVWLLETSGKHTSGVLSDDEKKDETSTSTASSPDETVSPETFATIS